MNQGLDEFTKLELSEPQDCVLDETDYGCAAKTCGINRKDYYSRKIVMVLLPNRQSYSRSTFCAGAVDGYGHPTPIARNRLGRHSAFSLLE